MLPVRRGCSSRTEDERHYRGRLATPANPQERFEGILQELAHAAFWATHGVGFAYAQQKAGIMAMGDPSRTRSLVATGGLEVRRMEELPFTWRFEDFDGYWRFLHGLA